MLPYCEYKNACHIDNLSVMVDKAMYLFNSRAELRIYSYAI